MDKDSRESQCIATSGDYNKPSNLDLGRDILAPNSISYDTPNQRSGRLQEEHPPLDGCILGTSMMDFSAQTPIKERRGDIPMEQ